MRIIFIKTKNKKEQFRSVTKLIGLGRLVVVGSRERQADGCLAEYEIEIWYTYTDNRRVYGLYSEPFNVLKKFKNVYYTHNI